MGYSSPREIAFHAVDYAKPEAIQGLLRHYYDFRSQAVVDMNAELICIYVDVMTAMFESTSLTERQCVALHLYMQGLTIEEIGKEMGITHQAVHKLITRITRKISKVLTEK